MRATSRRTAAALVTAGAGIALLAGCTAEDSAPVASETGATMNTASPTATPTPTPEAPPEPSADELARIDFQSVGPDGIPTATSVAFDGPGPGTRLRIEGACEGMSMSYSIVSAAADGNRDQVASGSFDCSAHSLAEVNVQVMGPLQVQFTDTGQATSGWIRVLSA